MEDFIESYYQIPFLISNLKEFISLSAQGKHNQALSLYNDSAQQLEKILEDIALENPSIAGKIQNAALEVVNTYEDRELTQGLIEGKLIPSLCEYLRTVPPIDVTEGIYTLRSSDTGFLTLKDESVGRYCHSTFDPMAEAYRDARLKYDPSMDSFYILGCGLGYLAYQVYCLSDGSTKIYVYEDDKNVLDYAVHYGVLSLIPEENLIVILENDEQALVEEFLKAVVTNDNTGFFVAPWKRMKYDSLGTSELTRVVLNKNFEQEIKSQSITNLRMNQKLPRLDFDELTHKFDYDEWVVICAGPSLDDNIAFLKESKGGRGLIAVNTVLRRLVAEGIEPDILVAADQRNDLTKHIEGIEDATKEVYLVADWLLSWKYAHLYKGPVSFIKIKDNSKFMTDFSLNCTEFDVSGTVAGIAIETAARLKAKKIYLVGQDLAFPSGRKYAKNMPHDEAPNEKWEIQVQSVDGSMVYTSEVFDWLRKSLEWQIEKNKNIKFINLSKHGALIKGCDSV